MNRREFLRDVTILGAGAAGLGMASSLRAAPDAKTGSGASAEPFVMGIIGTGARGQTVAANFASTPGVVIKYIADVDDGMLAKGIASVEKRLAKLGGATSKPAKGDDKDEAKAAAKAAEPTSKPAAAKPMGVKDFRRILEDKSVQAVAIATPDHWHTPAAILAIKAGKNVYVEKPCCHNPREGEMLVEAARKYNRVVQHGTQRRSWSGIMKGIAAVRGGEIGTPHFARAWYATTRTSIGRGKGAAVPSGLDYELWQGPAPERPYVDNLLPYNWHWFWNWGTGEMGNNGVHFLDLARWGLGVDYPKRVTSAGGRYFFADDWETPDTQTASFEFADRMIVWEQRSCQPRPIEGTRSGVSFHGDKGTLVIVDNGYKLYDPKDKLLHEVTEKYEPDKDHFADFVSAARTPTSRRATRARCCVTSATSRSAPAAR
jgi:predicted dehydrogenase